MKIIDMNEPLPEHPDLVACREALRRDGVNLAEVARQTGLSRRWLQYLRDGAPEAANPGIANLQKVLAHFGRAPTPIATA